MHIYRSAKAPFALSLTSLLLLTACGDGGGEGLGDTSALSSIEVNHTEEDEAPEVVLYDEVEIEENSSYVVSQGDGDQVEISSLLKYHLSVVDPETGDVINSTHDDIMDPLMPLPSLAASPHQIESFFVEALTADGVTVGSEVAVYLPADPEQGLQQPALYIFEILDQDPTYADGEEQEQSGDLPEIISEIGKAPELGDYDAESEPPSELSTEVLIAGEGEEIAEDDLVFAQYRGWRWEDGEIFDQSWLSEEDIAQMEEAGTAVGAEVDDPGQHFEFSLTGGVIEGWLEGIPGHHVGDRILLVIPPDQAYGETADEDEGTAEGGGPGGTLIFVVDIFFSLDAETLEELQASQQPEMPDMPEAEIDEDVVAELVEELGVSEAEIMQLLSLGVSPDELREIYQAQQDDSDDENTDDENGDDESTEDDTEEEDE